MKLVTYDLHQASSSRREELDSTLASMGFTAVLETVWVGAPRLTGDQILKRMNLLKGDKAIIANLHQQMPYVEFGLRPVSKDGEIDTAAIYERRNNPPTGLLADLLKLKPSR